MAVLLFFSFTVVSFAAPPKQMYYELKIYRLKDPGKGAVIDKYLKEAFIPAMHKAGIPTIGVFKPIETDTAYGKMVYVFIPYKTIDQYLNAISQYLKTILFTSRQVRIFLMLHIMMLRLQGMRVYS